MWNMIKRLRFWHIIIVLGIVGNIYRSIKLHSTMVSTSTTITTATAMTMTAPMTSTNPLHNVLLPIDGDNISSSKRTAKEKLLGHLPPSLPLLPPKNSGGTNTTRTKSKSKTKTNTTKPHPRRPASQQQQQQQEEVFTLNTPKITSIHQNYMDDHPKEQEHKQEHKRQSTKRFSSPQHRQEEEDNGLKIRVPKGYQYLLNVPFYIYEDWGLPSLPPVPSSSTNTTTTKIKTTTTATLLTVGGEPINVQTMDPDGIPIHSQMEIKTKHADDIYLTMAAMIHPMRTYDPSKAKLFYIPTPFNLLVDRIDDTNNSGDQTGEELCFHPSSSSKSKSSKSKPICNLDYLRHVNDELGLSKWYQRNEGRDHIAILSHWRWIIKRRKRFGKWKPINIYGCTLIEFEGRYQAWRNRNHESHKVSFPSYYVGKRCPLPQKQKQEPSPHKNKNKNNIKTTMMTHNKTTDFAMITTIHPHNHRKPFPDRVKICNWVQEESKHLYKMTSCGLGPQCPALAEAKFGFHARGDTPGSNRPMDTILSHTIPIFTHLDQYDVLPKWIDWDLISYFADVSTEDRNQFLSDLTRITSNDTLYQYKQQTMIQNIDLFDYNTIVPFDTYMYMFQVTLFPETKRHNLTSPYSALLLP